MKGWEAWLKDLINLITWMTFAFGLWWKAIDFLEKRVKEKSLGAEKVKELEKILKEHDSRISHVEDCCRTHESTLEGVKKELQRLLEIVLSWFKK